MRTSRSDISDTAVLVQVISKYRPEDDPLDAVRLARDMNELRSDSDKNVTPAMIKCWMSDNKSKHLPGVDLRWADSSKCGVKSGSTKNQRWRHVSNRQIVNELVRPPTAFVTMHWHALY